MSDADKCPATVDMRVVPGGAFSVHEDELHRCHLYAGDHTVHVCRCAYGWVETDVVSDDDKPAAYKRGWVDGFAAGKAAVLEEQARHPVRVITAASGAGGSQINRIVGSARSTLFGGGGGSGSWHHDYPR